MDINYLLFLQEWRDSLGPAIPDFFLNLSSWAVSVWPEILIAFVFWVFDRNTGRKLFGAVSLSLMLNGFLKATFTIYRPWIRDSRIEPYGNAKVEATGYSFPSGHTMYITPTVGGIGIWQWNKHKWVSIICYIVVALVMFSRNFLGCHTLEDVLIAATCGFLCIFVSEWIEKWIDEKDGRGRTALIITIAVCIAATIYYLTKPYPMDYDETGRLLADPYLLIADCFEGIGCVLAYYSARIIEKKGFAFDKEMEWKERFIIGVVACVPLFFWKQTMYPAIKDFSLYFAQFLNHSVVVFYVIAIVPWIMGKVHDCELFSRIEAEINRSDEKSRSL